MISIFTVYIFQQLAKQDKNISVLPILKAPQLALAIAVVNYHIQQAQHIPNKKV